MSGETTLTDIGNLTADPELRFTPSGVAVASFTVASTPRRYNAQSAQWEDGDPLFLRCSIWRQAAENLAESLTRGARVVVTGRLEQAGSREQLVGAAAVVEELVPADDGSAESAMRVVLGERYRTVRPFLGLLGGSGSLAAATGGGKILAAVQALPDLAARKVKAKPLQRSEIDADLVPPMWQRAVYANPGLAGVVDRDAYVVCVLEQLHRGTAGPRRLRGALTPVG